MQPNLAKRIKGALLCAAIASTQIGSATAGPAVVGIGDSIGEGVQAADAAWQTQVFSYIHLVSAAMATPVTIPLIQSDLFGQVGDTNGRTRIFPDVIGTNVAVSGADVDSILNDAANAANVGSIDSETDLVLFPRQQSQIEYVESVAPDMVLCWIGNNDVLSAVISFGNMNTSQLTPVVDFENAYIQLVNRLGALVNSNGIKVVFANIPDVTSIGFLLDRATASNIAGFPVNLPDGHFTSIVAAFLMNVFGNDDLMNVPDFVLDPAEVATIIARTQIFNAIIQREAARIGMPVVDMNAKFAEFLATPPVFFGNPLTTEPLGGLFSLDGVHPNNIAHGLIANEFISTMNQAFGMSVPSFDQTILEGLYFSDPSIDKDGDGQAPGRFGVGLLETLAFLTGLTGDTND